MRVGICGYPGSGKSTVFSALAPGGRADRDVAFGNIKVPDERVDFLSSVLYPFGRLRPRSRWTPT
jgi:ribosome-binding ATPase YchF (GTP1/OBG family)